MLPKKLSLDQAKDTGLAMVLLLLLAAFFWKINSLVLPAIAVLVLTMTWPAAFGPLARVWFGFSHLLGGIMSRILLSVIFYLVATPIGVIRRKRGADAMQLKLWKQGKDSVFLAREKTYTAEDLKKPY